MRILVTGSEGSLMQSVIPYLLEEGHEVVGIDNFMRYGTIERERSYEFVKGDLTNLDLVNQVSKNVDGVIQAAARIYGVGGFHKYPADILSHDVTLHQNILWASQKNSIPKVAYVSSSMVFERCKKHPCAEQDVFESLIPSTDYGLSKLMGERLSMAFSEQYGLKHVVWRPFNIITPFEKPEGEQGISHVFADFIGGIVIKKLNPLPIIGDGEQIRCFTWIEDVAKTIAKYSFNEITDNESYNLGNPEPVSMKDLANTIYEEAQNMGLLDKTSQLLSFKTVQEYSDDVKIRIPDVSKATKDLSWNAKVKMKDAVKLCLEETTEQLKISI